MLDARPWRVRIQVIEAFNIIYIENLLELAVLVSKSYLIGNLFTPRVGGLLGEPTAMLDIHVFLSCNLD